MLNSSANRSSRTGSTRIRSRVSANASKMWCMRTSPRRASALVPLAPPFRLRPRPACAPGTVPGNGGSHGRAGATAGPEPDE